jgi:hypothetical protein
MRLKEFMRGLLDIRPAPYFRPFDWWQAGQDVRLFIFAFAVVSVLFGGTFLLGRLS